MTHGEILARKFYASYRRMMQRRIHGSVPEWEYLLSTTREALIESMAEVLKETACEDCIQFLEDPEP